MPPTILDESVRSENYRITGAVIEKTVEQGAEERAKRKMTCDDDLQDDYNRKRKRKFVECDLASLSSSPSSLSSLSMDCDYGTDSELIAIDQNKPSSCRCVTSANDCKNLENDSSNCIIICSEHSYRKTQNTKRHDGVKSSSKTSGMRVDDIISKITSISKFSNSDASTTTLLDIAVATLKIIKKNREFQLKLTELQSDTSNFLNSILENPENHLMKERFKFSVL